ncbi:MAG: GNAT family N-acetyltransferase [Candidatus Lokiarchaeota archaeon]|nr:GNAT family N-acetyltransferase [Candidatus Lokiarchaeota archaeon]
MHYKQSKNLLNSALQLNPEIINTLETKRLLIKQINQKEFNSVDKEIHLILEKFASHSFFSEDNSKDKQIYSISHKINDQLLGLIFLKKLHAKPEMECFFVLLPQYTGNGYAIEALKKSIDFIFSNIKISTLFAYFNQNNKKGWRVAERSGMKYMGDIIIGQKYKKIMKFLMSKNDFENRYHH